MFNVVPDIHLEEQENKEMTERIIAQPHVLQKLKTVIGNEDHKFEKVERQKQHQIESRIN